MTSQTGKTPSPRRAISHLILPYLTPERAQCGMKRPTFSLEVPILSLRVGPFPDMNGLIRELREPRMGKGKRSKVYKRPRERPVTCLRGHSLPKMVHLRSEMAHSRSERTHRKPEIALRAHFMPDNSCLRPEEVQFGVEEPTLWQRGRITSHAHIW